MASDSVTGPVISFSGTQKVCVGAASVFLLTVCRSPVYF